MILIVAAMDDEIKALKEDLSVIEEKPFLIYKGKIQGKDIVCIQTGIGKVNAAQALTYVLAKYEISMVINIGFVGGYKLNKHQSYLISRSTYHDVDLRIFKYERGQIPKYPTYFLTMDNENSSEFFEKTELFTGDAFSTGVISDCHYAADMEGNAYAQVAYTFNVPFRALKIVSDVIGDSDQLDTYIESEKSLDAKLYEDLLILLKEEGEA